MVPSWRLCARVSGSCVAKWNPVLWRYAVSEVKRRTNRNYNTTVAVDLSGVFPPIPTPFNKDESIAYDKLARNIQHWETVPFQGQFVSPSDI
jgi:aconitase A